MIIKKDQLPPYTAIIYLQNGGFFICDAADAHLFESDEWHWARQSNGDYYAVRYRDNPDGGRKLREYGHVVLMPYPPARGLFRDHANGDGLDLRRSNIRWATSRQNRLNQRKPGKSGMYGVTETKAGTFQATVLGKYVGTFKTRDEAGKVRDARLREVLPAEDLPFVRWNFDEQGNRVEYDVIDHELPPWEPHQKSSPYRGVSVVGYYENGDPKVSVDLMINGQTFSFPNHRDEAQGARTYDQALQRYGGDLRKLNFPDVVAEVIVTLGVRYAITQD